MLTTSPLIFPPTELAHLMFFVVGWFVGFFVAMVISQFCRGRDHAAR